MDPGYLREITNGYRPLRNTIILFVIFLLVASFVAGGYLSSVFFSQGKLKGNKLYRIRIDQGFVGARSIPHTDLKVVFAKDRYDMVDISVYDKKNKLVEFARVVNTDTDFPELQGNGFEIIEEQGQFVALSLEGVIYAPWNGKKYIDVNYLTLPHLVEEND